MRPTRGPVLGVVGGVVLATGLALGLMLAAASPASAAPADPRVRPLAQPDGTSFDARLWGDEFVNGFETAAGYTVVADAQGRWSYAAADGAGSLRATGVAPGGNGVPPRSLGLRPHLRDAGEIRRAAQLREAAQAEHSGAELTSLGSAPTLVVLVRFADQSDHSTPAQWSDRLFGPTASVADYYDEVSRGGLAVVPAAESSGTVDDGVVGWIDLADDHPDTGGRVGSIEARELTVAALTAADPFVDFSAYDTAAPLGTLTPDELHVVIIPAGGEAADGCEAPTIWAHRGSLTDSEPTAVPPVLDGVVTGDGEVDGGYTMSSELGCDASGTYPQSIGILAHELGHDLGFVDLYDIDGSSSGVSGWSLMGQHRGQLPGEPSGTHPPHLDPFHRSFAGWLAPTPITSPQPVALEPVETTGSVVQLGDNPGGVDIGFLHRDAAVGEYFLVENRQPTGYDAALPGCGLLIWHVDESAFSNSDESRRLVDVEEAGEAANPDGAYADDSDPWPGSTSATLFDTTSTPDSRSNDGRPTGVSVTDFDAACAPTMHASVDPGGGGSSPPPVPPNDDFAAARSVFGAATVTGYNQGASRQSGEPEHDGEPGGASVWWQWTAPEDGLASLSVETTFEGVVGVYRGSQVDALTRVVSGPATTAAAGAPGPCPRCADVPAAGERTAEDLDVGPPSFPVEAGVKYRIAIDGREVGGAVDTGGIRLGVRFDPVAITVTPTPRRPAPGQRVTVEVAVRNLDSFRFATLYDVYDDAGHQCTPAPQLIDAGQTARCRFTLTAPGIVGSEVGGIVSAPGDWSDGTFLFQRVAWATVVAMPEVPDTTVPGGAGVTPGALARTGTEPAGLVGAAAALLVLGGGLVVTARRRRARLAGR